MDGWEVGFTDGCHSYQLVEHSKRGGAEVVAAQSVRNIHRHTVTLEEVKLDAESQTYRGLTPILESGI